MQIISSNTELEGVGNLGHKSSCSIDRMIENIGPEEGRKLLIAALPIIIERSRLILEALENNDINAAFDCAHRTAGSIRLYGSSRLEELLMEVMSFSVDQSPPENLCSELKVEFDDAINEIQTRLKVGLS